LAKKMMTEEAVIDWISSRDCREKSLRDVINNLLFREPPVPKPVDFLHIFRPKAISWWRFWQPGWIGDYEVTPPHNFHARQKVRVSHDGRGHIESLVGQEEDFDYAKVYASRPWLRKHWGAVIVWMILAWIIANILL